MKNIHKISAGVVVVGFLVIASAAYAQVSITSQDFFGRGKQEAFDQSIVGVVTAVKNNDLIVDIQASPTAAITSYTIETGNAKVLKSGIISLVGSIQINDKIVVIGTVSGTNITAKIIIDGSLPLVRGPPVNKEAA
jgi:hypothetical protein